MHTLRAIAVGAVSATLVGNAIAGGLSGAIYTTNREGTFVNGNVYDAAEDVYLNGGPPREPALHRGWSSGR